MPEPSEPPRLLDDAPMQLGIAVAVLAIFIGIHATPDPAARAALLAAAAVLIMARVARPNTPFGITAVAARIAETVIFIAIGIAAGPVKGAILAIVAAAISVIAEWDGPRLIENVRLGERCRALTLSAGCVGGAIVVFNGRWLHNWMQATLLLSIALTAAGMKAKIRPRW